ncbi:MAG: hypothetical protein AVO39_08185 [delta proteobacterium MLS_D]|jgi:hypothetical protein|nr:MAG: hypothetical protein AVO39_08185 [delta proteobacterium MLS_D]
MKERRLLNLIVAASILCGACSTTQIFRGEDTPASLEESALFNLLRPDNDETIRAVATVTIRQEMGTDFSRRVALAVQYPSCMRVDALPTFGVPDFFMSLRDGTFKVFVPSRQTLYTGSATSDKMYSFFGLDLSPEEIIALLRGTPPVPPVHKDNLKVDTFRNPQGEYRLNFLSRRGRTVQSVMLNEQHRMTEAKVFDEKGVLRYRALFSEYATIENGLTERPLHITVHIENPLNRTTLELRLSDLSVTRNDPGSLFDVPHARGANTIYLD